MGGSADTATLFLKIAVDHMALAIKDGSIAKVEKNIFNNNNENISMYIKKKLYEAPKLILNKDNTNLNIKNIKGEIIYQ